MTSRHQPELGGRVRTARLALGLAQGDLTGEGISASYVSLIEAGRREPTPAVLAHLAAVLQVETEYLKTGVGARDALQARTDLAFAKVLLHEGKAQDALHLLTTISAAGGLRVLDEQDRFEADIALAAAHERLGDLRSAVALLEGLRLRAQESEGRLPWLSVTVSLCRCYRDAGDVNRAVDLGEAALARCEPLGLIGLDAHTQLVSTLSGVYADRGDLLRAAGLLDGLLAGLGPDADNQQRGYAYWNAAMTAADRGERGEALQLVERAALLMADGEDRRNQARIKVAQAWIMLGQSPPDPEGARDLLRDALPSLRRSAGVEGLAKAETELSRAELLLGRPRVASRHAAKALALLKDGQPLTVAGAHTAMGLARLAMGDAEAGISSLHAAGQVLSQVAAPRQASVLWRQLAGAYRAAGDSDAAFRCLSRALDAVGIVDQPATAVLVAVKGTGSDVPAST